MPDETIFETLDVEDPAEREARVQREAAEELERRSAQEYPADAEEALDLPAAQPYTDDEEPPPPPGYEPPAVSPLLADADLRVPAGEGSFPEAVVSYWDGPLPAGVAEIWGKSRESELTARILIAEWGLQGFFNSAVNQQAMHEHGRDDRMDAIRKAFAKAQAEKEKKGSKRR